MSSPTDRFIPVSGNQLLVKKEQNWRPFEPKEWKQLSLKTQFTQEIISIEGRRFNLVELDEEPEDPELELLGLRELLPILDGSHTSLAAKAVQYAFWRKNHRYCGNCGSRTFPHERETALECISCASLYYPRINPCVMVLITRGEEILLAHNANFRDGMYSAVAGFIEVGESIEQTLEREVFEEVGLKVKNIEYFGSQPWPFPSQLMIAYTAEYESGDITVDGIEIDNAQWFHYKDLPQIPNPETIAGKLIRGYIEKIQ